MKRGTRWKCADHNSDRPPGEVATRAANGTPTCLVILLSALALSSCSLMNRPEPNAPDNVRCSLFYRPYPTDDASASDLPDLLFVALASPYPGEEYLHSPVDNLLHAVAAPGRHLSRPLLVEGADCAEAPWPRGRRLPQTFRWRRGMLCQRRGDGEVVFEVATKWGTCRQTIPEGTHRPNCGKPPNLYLEDRLAKAGLESPACRQPVSRREHKPYEEREQHE